jgi:ubiquinone/menaquinone biosynthesis C-methylase UbiE
MLHGKGFRAVGIDIGGEIRECKVWKHLLASFILGDGCKLPFASELFDVVVCCGALEHVYDERRFLKECGRVLKNDALFLCYYLPNKTGFESLFSKILPTGHKFYDKNSIELLFKKCGYEVLTVRREHVIPEPRFTRTLEVWNRSYKVLTLLDDVLARTGLRFFGDNWRVYARKARAQLD